MEKSLSEQLAELRQTFAEASPTDESTITRYAWLIVKVISAQGESLDGLTCRQLLADCMRLPLPKPSPVYSALLSAAVKVAAVTNDFHFTLFLERWDVTHLRPEDHERQVHGEQGHTYPSLVERIVKAYAHALLLRPEEVLSDSQWKAFLPLYQQRGFLPVQPMVVSRIKSATTREGRKLSFVTLVSPGGQETECVSSQLPPHPLRPLPPDKRHYVHIGQLYDVILRQKDADERVVHEAFLSAYPATRAFPQVVGYIESIDVSYGHMHIYDAQSRHFVAPVQRFSHERAGQFVRFLPLIPLKSKFKTAILVSQATASDFPPRAIRITAVNAEKGYASWELIDDRSPIMESQSMYQQSQGEPSPSYTTGYLYPESLPKDTADLSSLGIGSEHQAIVYLRRSKDGLKRPHVAIVLD